MSVNQQQILLRLPEDLTAIVRRKLRGGNPDEKATESASMKDLFEVLPDNAAPEETISTDGHEDVGMYIFRMDEKNYPAILTNMPTIVETHKTYDRNTFYKSGDIGQILYVFHSELDRSLLKEECLKYSESHGLTCVSSGLSAPTSQIVKRRFLRTRRSGPFPAAEVKGIVDQILNSPFAINLGQTAKQEVIDVNEEIVDFEPWMVTAAQPDGISVTLTSDEWNNDSILLQLHPEMLLLEDESDQDEDVDAGEASKTKTASVIESNEPIIGAAQNLSGASASASASASAEAAPLVETSIVVAAADDNEDEDDDLEQDFTFSSTDSSEDDLFGSDNGSENDEGANAGDENADHE